MWFERRSDGEGMHILRPCVIKSAGEPKQPPGRAAVCIPQAAKRKSPGLSRRGR